MYGPERHRASPGAFLGHTSPHVPHLWIPGLSKLSIAEQNRPYAFSVSVCNHLINAYIFVCLLQIILLVGFNHKLVEHNDICIRKKLNWLYTNAHDRTAIFDYLDIAFCSWHTIHALWFSRAWNLKVAPPNKLAKLLGSERIA